MHVAALHRAGPALEVVRSRLVPGGGRLYLFSQAPGWTATRQADAFAASLADDLADAGFTPVETLTAELDTGVVAAVISAR